MPSFLFTVAIRFLRFAISSNRRASRTFFASNSLVAISALFLTLATATSHSLCRLVETFAHTSRQLPRGNCHAISRRLWPIRSDHGSAPFDPTYSMISSALDGFRWLDAGELLCFSARVCGCLGDAHGNTDPGQFFGAPDM